MFRTFLLRTITVNHSRTARLLSLIRTHLGGGRNLPRFMKTPRMSMSRTPTSRFHLDELFHFRRQNTIILSCSDAHVIAFFDWILAGKGFRSTTFSYTPEARAGRFFWEPEGATYWSGISVSSYHTGGMASEFDRRMQLMLDHEKFTLLTASVSDITRDQYVRRWRRWARFVLAWAPARGSTLLL